jgi:hypothetical protein
MWSASAIIYLLSFHCMLNSSDADCRKAEIGVLIPRHDLCAALPH